MTINTLLLFSIAVFTADAQTPALDAASIKANRSLKGGSSIRLTRGHVSMENVSLKKLILNAYGIPDDREYMVNGPAWLATEHFDIEATFPGDTPPDTVRQMLRTMLAERFEMASHREVRQIQMYALAVAKNGPKIHAAQDGPPGTTGGPGRIEATKIPMTKLADLLARQLGVRVVDSTGLPGVFDFTLEWAPDETAGEPKADGNGGASIFAAVQDQLGLRLRSEKGPAEVLVVDRIEKSPTEN